MNRREAAAWRAHMRAARGRWTIDPVAWHNRRELLVYEPSMADATRGLWVRVDHDGGCTAGTFEGALPHIGEAAFTVVWRRAFASQAAAFAALAPRLGVTLPPHPFTHAPAGGAS